MANGTVKIPLVRRLVRQYRERLTPRGQYLLWSVVVLAVLGMDTRRTLVFWLFAMAAGMFFAAAAFAMFRRPRVRLDCQFPGLPAVVVMFCQVRYSAALIRYGWWFRVVWSCPSKPCSSIRASTPCVNS